MRIPPLHDAADERLGVADHERALHRAVQVDVGGRTAYAAPRPPTTVTRDGGAVSAPTRPGSPPDSAYSSRSAREDRVREDLRRLSHATA